MAPWPAGAGHSHALLGGAAGAPGRERGGPGRGLQDEANPKRHGGRAITRTRRGAGHGRGGGGGRGRPAVDACSTVNDQHVWVLMVRKLRRGTLRVCKWHVPLAHGHAGPGGPLTCAPPRDTHGLVPPAPRPRLSPPCTSPPCCQQQQQELLSDDLTDGILCDVGMPVIHRGEGGGGGGGETRE